MEISVPEFTRDNDRGQVGIETLIVFIAMILVAAIAASVLINTAGFLQNQASETSQDSEDQVSNQVLIISSIGEVAEVDGEVENVEFEIDADSADADEADLEYLSGDFDFESDDGDLIVRNVDEDEEFVWTDDTDPVTEGESIALHDEVDYSDDDDIEVEWTDDSTVWDFGTVDDSFDDTETEEVTVEDGENQISEISMTVMQSPGADEIDLSGASIEYIGPDGQDTLTYEDGFDVIGTQDEDETAPVLTQRQDRFTIEIGLEEDGEDLRYLEEGEDATVRITTQSGSEAVTIVNVPQSLSSYDTGDAVEL
ncbi:archaellin/type IV pilin N-terminal domain-containing protein [Natranaeroarchaeum sulfidigenes]|uniref:Flagellin n=1 Tax=Natranaeroarchaeum sulfidigenes TaxID=2784880 RepID=A0A897MU98_9EURY|nr:archaellin/type IV pilin N-terminal domain-containing protein [Natranaeroarchaeum sulfidigenes]QSG03608.1 Archaeal flagellin [Natranaeroarchaeum sulfidigenes]